MNEASGMVDIMNPNVLCPFGCTEHCRKCKHAEFDLIIQHCLPTIEINLFHPHKRLRKYFSMWRPYLRPDGDYDSVCANLSDYFIQPTIIFDKEKGPVVLTCAEHGSGSDEHRLYPPRTPHHALSSSSTDQLAHVVSTPRTVKTTVAKAYNTTFSMTEMKCTFKGIDTAGLTTHSNWSRASYLQSNHEALSLHGRSDIRHLLAKKVEANQISGFAANNMIAYSQYKYPEGSLDKYADGSTYICIEDVYSIQIRKSSRDDNTIPIKDRHGKDKFRRRSWPREINILQMEDSNGYGYPFRPTLPLNDNHRTSPAMIWLL